MKASIIMAAIAILSTTVVSAQIANAVTETVKVYGNCGMCKSSIEKAAGKKSIASADWNEDSKMAVITYNSKKTNLNAVLKNIALAGYDNQAFLAPDAAYNTLPDCCQYSREKKMLAKEPVKNEEMMSHAAHQQAAAGGDIQQANSFQAVYDAYFTVKDALIKADATAAAAKAADLLSALNAVKMEALKTTEHSVWMKEMKGLKSTAQEITASKGIDKQRAAFARLSGHLYTLIKVAAPAEKVYYQNCPMYNEGKGANWLSKESGIKNPYYGSMMLTCGKTVEEIQ